MGECKSLQGIIKSKLLACIASGQIPLLMAIALNYKFLPRYNGTSPFHSMNGHVPFVAMNQSLRCWKKYFDYDLLNLKGTKLFFLRGL